MSLVRLANEAVATMPSTRGEQQPAETKLSTALTVLVAYIPTEIVTIYIAALGTKLFDPDWVYWSCAAATPIVLFLIVLGKRKPGEREGVVKATRWKMAAATIAFLVWALAVPDSPLSGSVEARVGAGFAALLISMFLKLFDPIFGQSDSHSSIAA